MESEKLVTFRAKAFLLMITALLFISAGILAGQKSFSMAAISGIGGIFTMMLINRIYNTTNDSIRLFFDSLRNDDTTLRFPETIKNRSLSRLFESMNRLNDHFQDIRLKNEYNESYYHTLIQHASAGLLVINAADKVELINKTACNYAGISPESTNHDLLKIKHPAFYEAVCKLKPGESITYKNLVSNNLQLLMFRAAMIRRNEEELKLVSIQDIRTELQSKELESYRKLISVLTHEIMNMLAPLTSVAKDLYAMLKSEESNEKSSEAHESLIRTTINGLQLISEQSNGLVSFMNNYRKISKIPAPEFSTIIVDDWIEQLKIAFSGKMEENNIVFSISAEKNLKNIIADTKLLNQVMINIINNAVEALTEQEGERKIEIQMAAISQDRVRIRIINNGPLIPQELQEKIFIPFFTTRKTGSGIGLSISREIMKLHNGSLIALSSPESQTCFIVEF